MALLPYKADVRSCHSQQTGLSQIKVVAVLLLGAGSSCGPLPP